MNKLNSKTRSTHELVVVPTQLRAQPGAAAHLPRVGREPGMLTSALQRCASVGEVAALLQGGAV